MFARKEISTSALINISFNFDEVNFEETVEGNLVAADVETDDDLSQTTLTSFIQAKSGPGVKFLCYGFVFYAF